MRRLEEAICSSKPVRLVAWSVSPKIELTIKKILTAYLDRCGCAVLHDSMYTVLKELLINAVKANYKNIYFENYSPKNNAESVIPYTTALELFRLELSRDEGGHLADTAKKRGLNAEILWMLKEDVLKVEVINPVMMTDLEMRNVRKKLDFARECNDVTEYFLKEDDDSSSEGAGLGLILIMMILKSLGCGDDNLRVCSEDGKTTATLVVPLNEMTLDSYREHTR